MIVLQSGRAFIHTLYYVLAFLWMLLKMLSKIVNRYVKNTFIFSLGNWTNKYESSGTFKISLSLTLFPCNSRRTQSKPFMWKYSIAEHSVPYIVSRCSLVQVRRGGVGNSVKVHSWPVIASQLWKWARLTISWSRRATRYLCSSHCWTSPH